MTEIMHVSGSPHVREAYADQSPQNHRSLVKRKTNVLVMSVSVAQIQFPLPSPRKASCGGLHAGLYARA